jgi:hypothetical protein
MTYEVNSKTNKMLLSISKVLLPLGVLGFFCAGFLPFPEGVDSRVRMASTALIVLSIICSIKPLMREFKMQLRWQAEIAALSKANHKGKAVVKKQEFPTALYVVSVLFVALGFAFIFLLPLGYQSYRVQSEAPSWPHTTGEVISAEIIEKGLSPDISYQPIVVTQYSVGGKEYVTHDIFFNQSSAWEDSNIYAFQMTNKYYPGKQVRVYYNPDDAYMAVLDIRIHSTTYITLGLGCVFSLLGTCGFYFSIRETYRFIK